MKTLIKLSFVFAILSLVASCKNKPADQAAEVSDKAGEAAAMSGQTYNVDPSASMVMWDCSKPTATHNGTVNVSEGNISVDNGNITGGTFTIDMNTITVLDLEGDYKTYLEDHLKGTEDEKADDFFNVNKYPTGSFEITKVTKVENDTTATHLVYGNLTIKEQKKEVGFKANVEMKDGMINVSTPRFTINRTEWGIKYGSPSFFDNLKEKAIDDNVGLAINLVAKS